MRCTANRPENGIRQEVATDAQGTVRLRFESSKPFGVANTGVALRRAQRARKTKGMAKTNEGSCWAPNAPRDAATATLVRQPLIATQGRKLCASSSCRPKLECS